MVYNAPLWKPDFKKQMKPPQSHKNQLVKTTSVVYSLTSNAISDLAAENLINLELSWKDE
jgi:hypothetical protein